MDKFDRYYKSKNLRINEKLVNSYAKYDDKTLLISNGYSVVYTKTIRNDFIENTSYGYSINNYYKHFTSDDCEIMQVLDINLIKSDKDNEGNYKFSRDFGLDYPQLKKIIDIIGCEKINVKSRDNFESCFIEIVGKNNQVGYLLPTKIF